VEKINIMTNFNTQKKSSLIAIVTGLEHSGTTFLSRLITCHPKIDSGFECGVLLANSPQDFKKIQPFYEWMQTTVENGHWGIKKEDMIQVCSAKNWEEMYHRIILYSPIFKDKSSYILDKTPAYMPKLNNVLEKVNVPCLVIKKDILFQYFSFKKRGLSLEQFISRYKSYMNGLLKALEKFNSRIYIIEYEELYFNAMKGVENIFNFINANSNESLSWSESYSDGQNFNLFRENIKVDPFQHHFKYDNEIKKLKELTKEEVDALKPLQKEISEKMAKAKSV